MKLKVSRYVYDRIGRDRKDFKRETFFCGGKGGQKQNKTETGVRITDLVTGLSAEGREHRTQPQNQNAAFKRLIEKMVEYYESEQGELKSRIMGGETIRTYNEKRNEVKCHVTGARSEYKSVLDGDLDVFTLALLAHEAGEVAE